MKEGGTNQQTTAQLISLKAEVDRLVMDVQLALEEKEALKVQLENAKKDARVKIDELMDERRVAKARASQLERAEHHRNEVHEEILRLHNPTNSSNVISEQYVLVGNNRIFDADPDDSEYTVASAKLYDVICEQREAIEEERSMYFDLLAEHDDLLALLAQQGIVKNSLQNALLDAAGDDAVKYAMEVAQKKAIEQYGKYLEVVE